MKIIITGFNAFGNIKINPSERVVQMVSGLSRSWGFSELKTEVLRTEFEYAGNRIEELIKNEKPDISRGSSHWTHILSKPFKLWALCSLDGMRG